MGFWLNGCIGFNKGLLFDGGCCGDNTLDWMGGGDLEIWCWLFRDKFGWKV